MFAVIMEWSNVMSSNCDFVVPPLGAWIDTVAIPMQAWEMLALGVVISTWFVWRDWGRLPPGPSRRRVLMLCILTFMTLSGSIFLSLVVENTLSAATTRWFMSTVDRLAAHGCSTGELVVAHDHLRHMIAIFTTIFAAGMPVSLFLAMGWRNTRIRYLRPRLRSQA
jgi:hypothetical protein